MPDYDFRTQRIFLDAPLEAGAPVPATAPQANYLLNVLRMEDGAAILAFNGRDGEWLCRLRRTGKKTAEIEPEERVRSQTPPPHLHYLFAPLKHARLDYMVQKAVEMGAGRLSPIFTHHTQPNRVNTERMRANALEAAEQCGILTVPEVDEPERLSACLESWDVRRHLLVCDEREDAASPLAVLEALPAGPIALLIGPEGGFSPDERETLAAQPFVTRLSLGPRILRADTAAVAALAVIQASLGDWNG